MPPKPALKALAFQRTVSFSFVTITVETVQEGGKPPVLRITVSAGGREAKLQCPLLEMVEAVPAPGTREPQS